MRDFMGCHVSQVNEFGSQEDVDGVEVSTSVSGSFRAKYYGHIDKVCVGIEGEYPGRGRVSMQLTVEQAVLLRELVDAAIADALEATTVEGPAALPAGGEAA